MTTFADSLSEIFQYAVEGSVRLGEGTKSKHYSGADQYEHPVLADDEPVGIVRVIPKGDDLHLEWAGLNGLAPTEGAGEFGTAHIAAIRHQLADLYPNQTHLTGLRASGKRKGVRFRVPLRQTTTETKPVEPLPNDPFELLRGYGLLKNKRLRTLIEKYRRLKYSNESTSTELHPDVQQILKVHQSGLHSAIKQMMDLFGHKESLYTPIEANPSHPVSWSKGDWHPVMAGLMEDLASRIHRLNADPTNPKHVDQLAEDTVGSNFTAKGWAGTNDDRTPSQVGAEYLHKIGRLKWPENNPVNGIDWRPSQETLPEDLYAMKRSEIATKYADELAAALDPTKATTIYPINNPPKPQRPIPPETQFNRVDEDLLQFRKRIRPLHALAIKLNQNVGVKPNTPAERELLHKLMLERNLKVKEGVEPQYDEATHTFYHPTPNDPVAVANDYIRFGTGKVKFAAEKEDEQTQPEPVVHPLIAGHLIEHALRRLSTDPKLSDNGQQLAKSALSGHFDALYPLNYLLQDEDHPMAGRDWIGALHKLHIDDAVGKGADAVGKRLNIWQATPSDRRSSGLDHLSSSLGDIVQLPFDSSGTGQSAANEVVELLKGQGHSSDDLLKSIQRHRNRGWDDWRLDKGIIDQNEIDRRINAPTTEADPNRHYERSEKSEKYQHSPALSDFIQALRQVRSSNQQVRRDIAKAQYDRLRLNPVDVTDAIADSPMTASAGTAHTIEHAGDFDKIKAAASLIGLQTNAPSMLVFHSDSKGPDRLLQVNSTGSGERLRQKMDEFGLTHRTMIPTQNGWSTVVFDKGGGLEPVVRQFAQSIGSPVNVSVGTGEIIGNGNEAEADKGVRKSYKSIISSFERKLNDANLSTQSTGPADTN